jgi:transposase InsO family protein
VSKIFSQDNTLWIRLTDSKRPRTALFLPARFRKRAMCEAHGATLSGHDADLKTYIRLTDHYFWPTIKTDISAHIKACVQCQLRKRSSLKKVPLQPMPTSDMPNERIHVDLFGPLKTSEQGKKYILVITDSFTKYAEVIAIANKEATTVAKSIIDNWICRFGSPIQIHSDGGKEFVNKLSEELFNLLDIKHTKTTPCHPQANAQVEVFNKTVAKYLASFVNESTLDWEVYIPALMFSYNTSYHSTIMTTPFELLYGMKARTPSFPGSDLQKLHYGESFAAERIQILQNARKIAKQNIDEKQIIYKEQYDKSSAPHEFVIGDLVLYTETNFLGRNQKLSPKWLGPAEIVQLTETNATLKLKNGKTKQFHLLRIKPFVLEKQRPEMQFDSDEDDFSESDADAETNEIFNQPAPRPQTRAHTRALAQLLEEHHTINFITEDLRYKLSRISEKLYRNQTTFNELTPEEQKLWLSFDIGDITFFLSGQRERTPEYTQFMRISRQQPANVVPHPVAPLPPVIVPPAPVPAPAPAPNPIDRLRGILRLKLPPGFNLNPQPAPQPGPAPHPDPVRQRTPPAPPPLPGPSRSLPDRAARYLTRTLTGKRKKRIIWSPPQ